jgi:Sulfatase
VRDSTRAWDPSLRAARIVRFLASRLLLGAFLLLTSAYCLLAYIPFTYFGFIHDPLMPWITTFVRIHAYLYWAVLSVLAADLIPEFRRPNTRTSAVAFVILNFLFSVYQAFHRGLANLSPGIFSYVWAMLALFPLLWLAAIDMAGSEGSSVWGRSGQRRHLMLGTSALAAFAVGIAFGGTALLRQVRNASALPADQALVGFGASLAFHFVIFAAFGLAMYLFRILSDRTPWPDRAYSVLSQIFVCCLCAQVLRSIVLPSISFEGFQADLFCVAVSLVLVIYVAALRVKLRGMTAVNQSAMARQRPSGWLMGAAAASLCGIAYTIPIAIGPTDWDFVLQKIAVLAVWSAVLGFLGWSGFSIGGKAAKAGAVAVLIVVVAGLGPYRLQPAGPNWSDVLDRYAGWDISFKTAYTVWTRSVRNDADTAFYEFLKQNTNLRQPIGPAGLSLVGDLKPSPGKKPNIFVFVIDSLRPDYLSPYNATVDFTPEIGRFGEDSVVLRNAFTRYGGTALSEPAIWAGVLLPHKQFVQPFYPVNNLQRLIDTEGYQSYISVDPILQQILRMSPSITQLDEGTKQMSQYDYAVLVKGVDPRSISQSKQNTRSWSNLDFVNTLSELESKIDARADAARPIFVYTQPQNVHTLTLEQSRTHGSRREITIAELRRIDTAFGEFIRFLRARGLYDNSIIVLTADHGDAYGEFGRFGHSDFLFPEVIRIPLIIHLPPQMRKGLVWNAQKIAFSIDITPSLYYVLGCEPTLNSELAGRPLFTRTIQEQDRYLRSQYLVVSSYAPVYAILGQRADTLFIVDAVNQRNYFYDLSLDPGGVHNRVTARIRDEGEDFIRRQITLIGGAYGVRTD